MADQFRARQRHTDFDSMTPNGSIWPECHRWRDEIPEEEQEEDVPEDTDTFTRLLFRFNKKTFPQKCFPQESELGHS